MLQPTTTDLDELRYDGPIPPRQGNPARELRQRLKLFRRMAMDYAVEANRQDRRAEDAGDERLRDYHQGNATRSRRNLADARRAHSVLAAELGRIILPCAVEEGTPMLDPDIYPRTYAQARARGLSDKDADEMAHAAEQQATAEVMTVAGQNRRQDAPTILASP